MYIIQHSPLLILFFPCQVLRGPPLREVSNLVPIWQYIYVSFFLTNVSFEAAPIKTVFFPERGYFFSRFCSSRNGFSLLWSWSGYRNLRFDPWYCYSLCLSSPRKFRTARITVDISWKREFENGSCFSWSKKSEGNHGVLTAVHAVNFDAGLCLQKELIKRNTFSYLLYNKLIYVLNSVLFPF